jgi:hypothetical protein
LLIEASQKTAFIVVTQCEADSTEIVLGELRKIALSAVALSSSTFLLSTNKDREAFPGHIVFAIDPAKIKPVKAVFIPASLART